MSSRIGEPQDAPLTREQLRDHGGVIVGEGDRKSRLQVVVERDIAQHVERFAPARLGQRADRASEQLRMSIGLRDDVLVPQHRDRRGRELLAGARPPRAVGIRLAPTFGRDREHLRERRNRRERRGISERDELSDRAAGHLCPDIRTLCTALRVSRQLGAVRGARRRTLRIGQDRRPVDGSSERALEVVQPLVVVPRRDVHDAASDFGGDAHQRFHFVLRRDHGRHRASVGAGDEPGAIRGKTQCAAAHGVGDECAHGRQLRLGGAALRSIVTHHVDAYGGVTDIAAEVDCRLSPLDRVEIFGIRLEVPHDAGLHRGHAHVLDRLERAQQTRRVHLRERERD